MKNQTPITLGALVKLATHAPSEITRSPLVVQEGGREIPINGAAFNDGKLVLTGDTLNAEFLPKPSLPPEAQVKRMFVYMLVPHDPRKHISVSHRIVEFSRAGPRAAIEREHAWFKIKNEVHAQAPRSVVRFVQLTEWDYAGLEDIKHFCKVVDTAVAAAVATRESNAES